MLKIRTLRLHTEVFTGTETKTKVCSLKQIMYLRGHFRLLWRDPRMLL
jgi:hypothetical protein